MEFDLRSRNNNERDKIINSVHVNQVTDPDCIPSKFVQHLQTLPTLTFHSEENYSENAKIVAVYINSPKELLQHKSGNIDKIYKRLNHKNLKDYVDSFFSKLRLA